MGFQGADTDQLRHLAQSYSEAAERCQTLFDALGRQVDAVEWVGPDADSFRSGLEQVLAQLLDAAQQIAQRGTTLDRDAEEQDDASRPSEADGGGAGNPLSDLEASGEMKTLSSPSLSDVLPDDPHKVLGVGEDTIRAMGLDKLSERLGDDTRSAKFLKVLPFLGAVPDAIELSRSLAEGDTTGSISNSVEIGLGITPGPLAAGASTLNSLASGLIPGAGDRTFTDFYAEVAAENVTTKHGEALGHLYSDLIGLDDDSTARNVISSAGGAMSHIVLANNPMTKSVEVGTTAVRVLKSLPGL